MMPASDEPVEFYSASDRDLYCGNSDCQRGNLELDEFMEKMDVCALAVMHEGKLHTRKLRSNLSKCADMESKKRYGIASITKSITALALGRNISVNGIPIIDVPAQEYLQDTGISYPKSDVTIKHLLQMSSGMRWREGGNTGKDLKWMASHDKNENPLSQAKSIKTVVADYVNSKPKFGKHKFNYSGFDTQLLGLILANESGVSPFQIVNGMFWDKTDSIVPSKWSATWSAKWQDDHEGQSLTFCCMKVSDVDLAMIGDWIMHQYNIAGDTISDWIKESIHDSVQAHSNYSRRRLCEKYSAQVRGFRYGYQWWIPQWNNGKYVSFLGIGKRGQFLHVFPEKNVVIAQLSNRVGNSDPSGIDCKSLEKHGEIVGYLDSENGF